MSFSEDGVSGIVGRIKGDFSGEFLISVIEPRQVVSEDLFASVIILNEESGREDIIIPKLRGNRGNVESLHNVVICLSIRNVTHCLHCISLQS
jgi:hypothetical protein